MNELPSSKTHIVEALLYAGLLRAALAMRAKAGQARALVRRIKPQQWMRCWNRQLDAALEHLLGVELALDLETLLTMLVDPNRGRIPTRYAYTDGELSA